MTGGLLEGPPNPSKPPSKPFLLPQTISAPLHFSRPPKPLSFPRTSTTTSSSTAGAARPEGPPGTLPRTPLDGLGGPPATPQLGGPPEDVPLPPRILGEPQGLQGAAGNKAEGALRACDNGRDVWGDIYGGGTPLGVQGTRVTMGGAHRAKDTPVTRGGISRFYSRDSSPRGDLWDTQDGVVTCPMCSLPCVSCASRVQCPACRMSIPHCPSTIRALLQLRLLHGDPSPPQGTPPISGGPPPGWLGPM